jgi:hypothetical protein
MPNMTELLARGYRPYRKTTITLARQMPRAFKVRLDTGDVIAGKPGDYACVSPDDGGRWIVDRQIFEDTYRLVEYMPDHALARGLASQGFRSYRKHQITWAKRIRTPRIIKTLEGLVQAHAGDYLCIGPSGDQWPQPAARFEAHYEQVQINQTG